MHPDILQRKGHYPVPPGASDLPGLEVAGVIESGDAQALAAAGFKLGDRICALVAGGGYAQLCVAPVGRPGSHIKFPALRVSGDASTPHWRAFAHPKATASSGPPPRHR
jgi:NADPH:quinone reductase-like Zn-dependent oxidoreductase